MFGYDHEILERYPTIRAGVLLATGLVNRPSPPELVAAYQAEQQAVARRLEVSAMADLPSIAAWRRAFAGFGAKPTQYRSAAEALLRRLTKRGEIPSVNSLVDIGNLVSIRYAMPVAVVDREGISGPITVRFATGEEPFNDLGSAEIVNPEPGEVVFVDDDGVACARRWCWRQSAQSATGPRTTEAVVIVEGHHDTAEADVTAALDDLASLLDKYQPGSRIEESYVLPVVPR